MFLQLSALKWWNKTPGNNSFKKMGDGNWKLTGKFRESTFLNRNLIDEVGKETLITFKEQRLYYHFDMIGVCNIYEKRVARHIKLWYFMAYFILCYCQEN